MQEGKKTAFAKCKVYLHSLACSWANAASLAALALAPDLKKINKIKPVSPVTSLLQRTSPNSELLSAALMLNRSSHSQGAAATPPRVSPAAAAEQSVRCAAE